MHRVLIFNPDNPSNRKFITVNIGRFEEYMMYLSAELFDVARILIGNTVFEVMIDDEALLKEDVKISLLAKSGYRFAGTLIFTKSDSNGLPVDLTDDDIKLIISNYNTDKGKIMIMS